MKHVLPRLKSPWRPDKEREEAPQSLLLHHASAILTEAAVYTHTHYIRYNTVTLCY